MLRQLFPNFNNGLLIIMQEAPEASKVVPVNSIMVKRVADYLPEKLVEKTGNPKASGRFPRIGIPQYRPQNSIRIMESQGKCLDLICRLYLC